MFYRRPPEWVRFHSFIRSCISRENNKAMGRAVRMREKDLAVHRKYMRTFQHPPSQTDEDDLTATCAPSSYRDAYEILHLPRDATHTQIRQAYRRLALQFHPDRNNSEHAQAKWDGVPAAYALLANPNERQQYDQTLAVRDALVAFYRRHNPAKLDNATIQTIVDGWKDNEVELFRMLHLKYEIPAHRGVINETQQLAWQQAVDPERKQQISKDSASFATCLADHKQAKDKNEQQQQQPEQQQQLQQIHGFRGKFTYLHQSLSAAICCRSSRANRQRYEATITETPGNPLGLNAQVVAKTPAGPMTLEEMQVETTTGADRTNAKRNVELLRSPSSQEDEGDGSSTETTPEEDELELRHAKPTPAAIR